MFDPRVLVSRLGGIARGTRLQEFGLTRTQLATAVRAGTLERIRPGLFVTDVLAPAIRTAASHGGALTCAGALRLHGVWVLSNDEKPHVWLGQRGRSHPHEECQCVNHFHRGAPPLGIVDVETALVHLFRCEGAESFFVSFESAWRRRLLSEPARRRIRAALPAKDRWLIEIARSDADSGLESLLRLRLHMLGIPLECQITIDGVGRVDFVIAGRLIIEADGKENHATAERRHRDLVRDAVASRLGYETLRFDYSQLVHDWATVQAAILGALRRIDSPS